MKLDFTAIPLVDRPDFDELCALGVFDPYTACAVEMNRSGYCKVDLQSAEFKKLCKSAIDQLQDIFRDDLLLWKNGKGQSPRHQDGWKTIKAVKQIATNKLILRILKKLYGRKPFPFQTLNFPVGSQQPFHSDALHFHCYPHGFMCGVWIPFEDISPQSGPLLYYAGSHRLPYLSAESLRLTPLDIKAESHPQTLFQSEWERLLNESTLEKSHFLPCMSEALIWHANLLHGGEAVLSRDVTRWSQVTHYYFEECVYLTPMHCYAHAEGGATLRNPYNIISGSTIFTKDEERSIKSIRLP